MKIFITGGIGFIGYHLSKRLLTEGHEVTIYDNFLNFTDPTTSHYPLYLNKRLEDLKEVQIIRGDTRHRSVLVNALKDTQPDVIIHLAAIAIANLSKDYSEEMVDVNLGGTVTLLESIRVIPSIKRFIFASSSFIYGHFQYDPADENHPTNPIDMYGGTKLAGEIFTKIYCNKYKIPWVIIRPSAVYGPTDANQRVSQIFVEKKLEGLPVFLEDGGEGKLDFTYVKDTAQGFTLALKESANNETFNITYGRSRSIKEYANILGAETLVSKSEQERPKRGTLDITKAKLLLDYLPEYPLERGLMEYEEYVKGVL